MPLGPGKYDQLATQARTDAKARGVVLIVVEGEYGSGFSVQADTRLTMQVPELLRFMAKQIETDLGGP